MTTYNKQNSVVWQDALDDGSLTLRAEHLLLRLPHHTVPAHSCLFTPNLINKLANQMSSSLETPAPNFESELLIHIEAVFDQLGSLEDRTEISQKIEHEWVQLRAWLQTEVSNPSDSAGRGSIHFNRNAQ